jgi:thymidine phosphorylase
VVELGGGRRRASDPIDHSVGLEALVGVGAAVDPDTPLAIVHASNEAAFAAAEVRLRAAYAIAEGAPPETPLILERIA